MTDPPSQDGRTARSDSASRLAALLADVVESPAPAPATHPAPPEDVRPETSDPAGATPVPTVGDDEVEVEGAAAGRDEGAEPTGGEEGAERTGGDTRAPAAPGGAIGSEAPPTSEPEPDDEAPGEATEVHDVVTAGGVEADGPVGEATEAHDFRALDADDLTEVHDRVDVDADDRADVEAGGRVDAEADDRADADGAGAGDDAVDDRPLPDDRGEPVGGPATGSEEAPPSTGGPSDGGDHGSADLRPDPAVADPPLRRVTLRAVAFGTALVLLVAAVPALGWVGRSRLLDSRGGDVVDDTAAPGEPNYRAFVTPTPTTFVVLRDPEGNPATTTLVSLGAGETGGTLIQVPLTTQVHNPFMIRRLIGIWDDGHDDERFRQAAADILGVAVPGPLIDLTDESLASLVAPVAPLHIEGTDPVVTDDGTSYGGDIDLAAEEVGPYLRATVDGEHELAHMARNERVWKAWMDALHARGGAEDAVGTATTGIGPFLRVLAGGPVMVETLEVESDEPTYFGDIPPLIPTDAFDEQIATAVPFPQSSSPGRRATISLLNGAEGSPIPLDLMQDLVRAGGAIITVGNAASFGRDETVVEYSSSGWSDEAAAMAKALGAQARTEKMSAMRAESTDEDMVITIGQDVLERYETGG